MTATRDEEFEAFVRAHRGSLVRLATALAAGDAYLAEDLVQGALIRVYLAKPSRTPDLFGYVRKAVVNGLVDHKRRPFAHREQPSPAVPDHAVSPHPDDVDPELMADLASLPVRMRAAVVLRHVEGLSVEETAAALRCTAGTVKSQTAHGIGKLRGLITTGEFSR